MSTTRRNFLRHAGTAAVFTASMPLAAIAQKIIRPTPKTNVVPTRPTLLAGSFDPLYMGQGTFVPYLNSTFKVTGPSGERFLFQLIEVANGVPASSMSAAAASGKESFSLVFRSQTPLNLRQDVYSFKHSALGRFSLFMAPTNSVTYGQVYVVVINHLDS
jgi:hypothetical protein